MKYLSYTLIAIVALLTTSCGEDRSGEFYALIEDRMWIEETMKKHYLWYEEMPTIKNEYDYFKQPESFFKGLLSKQALNGKGDKYSYMETTGNKETARAITLERTSTYGMEFQLTTDPTGTTNHTFARILYVLPESPADKAGIRRGDWITSINEQRITNDNYPLMKQGNTLELTRGTLVRIDDLWNWEKQDTLTVSPSVTMEINPFLVNNIYTIDGLKIAYMVYNEFAAGPMNNASESTYNEQMKQIFTQFKAQNPDAFILDLRYNNGGYLQCAQALGSLLAPTTAMGKEFIKLTFNNQTDPQSIHYVLDEQYAEANLGLSKIYILTSELTASASEAVINGLIPYLGSENVVLIGTRTEGKNVAMTSYTNEAHGLTIYPVVAYVANAEDNNNYSNGFEPQYLLDENKEPTWYALGDPEEFLLKNTLSLIVTGTMPDMVPAAKSNIQVTGCSIAPKSHLINLN